MHHATPEAFNLRGLLDQVHGHGHGWITEQHAHTASRGVVLAQQVVGGQVLHTRWGHSVEQLAANVVGSVGWTATNEAVAC